MSTMVEVKNLVKAYNGVSVVNDVSFAVKTGEVFGILGPNGAGKTTTLEMLESLRKIDGGTAIINGIDVAANPQQVRAIIGVQPQSPSFQDKTTLVELLSLFGAAYGLKIDVMKHLREVQLEDKAKSYIEQLSGGQRQRFSIAAALVHEPKVFFLDEPTTGLDPQARRNLWELIKTIKQRGVTVVITTHYMEEAELLCDRIAILDQGKIVALDSPKKLITALLKKGFKKEKLVEQANLEDVFINLTGKALRD